MFEKFMEKFAKREETEEEMEFKPFEEVETKEIPQIQQPKESVVESYADQSKADSVELKVVRPESYEEVSTVADNLLAGCTVVLNLEVLDRPTMLRMLDFLNGVTYCTDGEIKKVAQSTFIITPHSHVDISDI